MNRLAYYKERPTQSIPHRPGAVQCVRNCPTCIIKPDWDDEMMDVEELISITSFEDLVFRKSLWWSSYCTIQYHPGQMEILLRQLSSNRDAPTIYVVAAQRIEDMEILRMVLVHEEIPEVKHLDYKPSWLELFELKLPALAPIKMTSCYTTRNIDDKKHSDKQGMMNVIELRDFLEPIVSYVDQFDESKFEANIVPIVISKDHDESRFFGYGSVCVQILEPYSLKQYLRNLKTRFKTGHLVTHLYHDLARNAPKLPCHLVAFILFNSTKQLTRDELVGHFEWLRHASMELNLQLAFTGSPDKAVDFALIVLGDYVTTVKGKLYLKNDEAIREYAQSMLPNVAYYGIVSRAILMIHNSIEQNNFLLTFDALSRIRVLKDDVVKLSERWAEAIDMIIPCRRPCVTIDQCIKDTIENMQTFGRYLKIEEPKVTKARKSCPWEGDYDSDEEYFQQRSNDPAFKTWIVLTTREKKLERLHMFMSAITNYLPTV